MSDNSDILRDRAERRHKIDDNQLRFDKTINLGNVITVIIFLFTLMQMYSGIISRIDRVEVKVETLWNIYNTERLQK